MSSPLSSRQVVDEVAEISAIAAADVVYDYLALLTMGVDGHAKTEEVHRDEL